VGCTGVATFNGTPGISDRIALIRELASAPEQDQTKLFVTYKALNFRKAHANLFARGEYIPLETRGAHAAKLCAFARRLEDQWAIAVAPRWTMGIEDWGDTEIAAPPRRVTGRTPSPA
jgi:(1->4)-alpha-D-glucan 1-alpha-D-glucosylmutase